MIIPVKKTFNNAGHIDAKLIDFSEICQKKSSKIGCFLLIVSWQIPPPPPRNFLWNRPIFLIICPWKNLSKFESFPLKSTKSADILRILTFFPTKSYKIGRIFREFAPENPAKFCFFSPKYQKPCLLVCLYTVIYWFLNCLIHSKFILCGSRKYPYPPPHGRDLPYEPPPLWIFQNLPPKFTPPPSPLWNFQNFCTPPGNFAISNYWSEQRSSFVQ